MKKVIAILILGIVLSTWGAVCPKDGEDGMRGATGSSGAETSWSYTFLPGTNPYTANILMLDLDKVQSGEQTVVVYISTGVNSWAELPYSKHQAGTHVEFLAFVLDAAVLFRAEVDSVVTGASASGGAICMVVVTEFGP